MNSAIRRPEPVAQPPIEIEVPHLDSTRTFIYQEFGPNTYANVQSEIERADLTQPTMAETASLLDRVFDTQDSNYNSSEFNRVRKIMKDRWLWAFTGTLWAPEGAYVQDHPEIKEGMPYMGHEDLKSKLEQEDPSVRFVPYGFQRESMRSLKLAKNSYIIALAGEEGADKLARVADNHKNKPYLWAFDKVNDAPITRVSALDSGWIIDVPWLDVGGGNRGDGRYGYAFGCQK